MSLLCVAARNEIYDIFRQFYERPLLDGSTVDELYNEKEISIEQVKDIKEIVHHDAASPKRP